MHKIFRALEMLCLMQIENIVLVGRHFSDFSCSPRECSSRTPINEYNKEFRRDDDPAGPLSKNFSCQGGIIRSTVKQLSPQYLSMNPAGLSGTLTYRTSSGNLSKRFRHPSLSGLLVIGIKYSQGALRSGIVSSRAFAEFFSCKTGLSLVSLQILGYINRSLVFFVSFTIWLRFCCEIRQVFFFLSVQKCLADSEFFCRRRDGVLAVWLVVSFSS